MSVAAGVLEAFGALRVHRLRTLLTLLGIIIGVGAVVVIVALGQAMEKKVLSELAAFGSDLMWVSPGARTASGVRVRSQSLTLRDVEAMAEVPGVAAVAPVVLSTAQASYGNANWTAAVQGVTPAFLTLSNRTPVAGRGLTT
jgi:putative ABC transport system permease protein